MVHLSPPRTYASRTAWLFIFVLLTFWLGQLERIRASSSHYRPGENVCWISDVAREFEIAAPREQPCPAGMAMYWLQRPPEEPVAEEEFPVAFRLTIDESQLKLLGRCPPIPIIFDDDASPIVTEATTATAQVGGPLQCERMLPYVEHVNVHACPRSNAVRRPCIPIVDSIVSHLISYNPSRSLYMLPHHAAPGNAGAGLETLVAGDVHTTFLLDLGLWTVIAHARVAMECPDGVQSTGGTGAGIIPRLCHVDIAMGQDVITNSASASILREVFIILLGILLLALLVFVFVYKWRAAKQDHAAEKDHNRVFMTRTLKSRLNRELFILSGFTILELFDIASDTAAYLRVMDFPDRDRHGVAIPMTFFMVVALWVSGGLFLVRLYMFRAVFRRRQGKHNRSRWQNVVLDAETPAEQLSKYKRAIYHAWVSLILAAFEDLPFMFCNSYLLFQLDQLSMTTLPIIQSVLLGLGAFGIRMSLVCEVVYTYDNKAELVLALQDQVVQTASSRRHHQRGTIAKTRNMRPFSPRQQQLQRQQQPKQQQQHPQLQQQQQQQSMPKSKMIHQIPEPFAESDLAMPSGDARAHVIASTTLAVRDREHSGSSDSSSTGSSSDSDSSTRSDHPERQRRRIDGSSSSSNSSDE